ncbi:MltA domain-containing protein, partial [Acinetobacter baumannii]
AWLDDPFALLQLQVQGSGRLLVREPDGRERLSRVAFAGHNDQPFQSVVRPLLDRGEVADATPATLRDWARRNPAKVGDA